MESLRYGGKETDKVVEARITARLRYMLSTPWIIDCVPREGNNIGCICWWIFVSSHRTRTAGILGQRSAGKVDHNMDFQSHLKTFLTYIRGSQDWKPLAATDDKDDIDPNSTFSIHCLDQSTGVLRSLREHRCLLFARHAVDPCDDSFRR